MSGGTISHAELKALRRANFGSSSNNNNGNNSSSTMAPNASASKIPAPPPKASHAQSGPEHSPSRAGHYHQGQRPTSPSSESKGGGFVAKVKATTDFSALEKYKGYPSGSLTPKLYKPTETHRGHIPRNVEAQRRRYEYDQFSIEQLLGERGVDYFRHGNAGVAAENPNQGSLFALLPLEAFDDTTFDERSVEDWCRLGNIPTKDFEVNPEQPSGLPALALRNDEVERFRWLPCKIMDWNTKENKLLVEWETAKRKIWLPRIHVHIRAEDPRVFADRVAKAHELRKDAESKLRTNLYVDSMPLDESYQMDEMTAERIRDLSINTAALLRNEENLSVGPLLQEANTEYARTMNKLLFERMSQDPTQRHLFKDVPKPKYIDPEPIPEFGQVQMPKHDFRNVVAAFHQNSYLAKQEEVILAMQKVRDECNSMMNATVFVLHPQIDTHLAMYLDEFEELQNSSITTRVVTLKDQWCNDIREHISTSLAGADESKEVNLKAGTREEYEASKLKRLVRTAKHMMRDTLYSMMTTSLEEYVQFVEGMCTFDVTVNNMSEVLLSRKGRSLFKVELVERENKLGYSSTIDQIRNILPSVFDRSIDMHSTIPVLEVMPYVYNSVEPYIPCIQHEHHLVVGWRKRLEEAVDKAMKPLLAYLETYKEFEHLIAMDPATYIKEYEESNPKLAAIDKEVKKHYDMRDEVLRVVPQSVNLGTFVVDCNDFRRKLAEKCVNLAQRVLDLLSRQSKNKAEDLSSKFNDIAFEAKKPPVNIEELTKTKEYLRTIPEQTYDLIQSVNDMKEFYEVLEKYHYVLPGEDFERKWKAIAWPKKMEETVEQQQSLLEDDRGRFLREYEQEKVQFASDVDRLGKKVVGFAKHSDRSQVAEYAKEVRKLQKDIAKYREDALRFNTREVLFGRDKEDYTPLNQIAKDFEPYATLWTTADDWRTMHHSWMNDPFDTVDAEDLDKQVQTMWKNILKSTKAFKDKPSILKISEEVKSQIDEFRPIIPVVKFLRTQGMQDRHWAQICKEVGFEVRPGVTLRNMQDVYNLDLNLHQEAIMKVSEVANKEYQIEQSLNKMKEEWEPIKLNVKPYKVPGTFTIGKEAVEEIQQLLDDNMLSTQALQFSPFKKMFETEIEEWEQTLKLVQQIIDEWLTCQRTWMYLESIFQNDDITRQLPTETKRFNEVNKNWKFLTQAANENPGVINYCRSTEDCLKLFLENNEKLDKVQKGLNQYLENKRASFARFYFLSDEELLTILSEAKDPQNIQAHFRKIFEAIYRIDMRKEEDNEMFGFRSEMGEYIAFKETVFPRKNIENWLSEIETMMKRSVRHEIAVGIEDYKKLSRKEFVLKVGGQVAISVCQIFWTQECEHYMNTAGSLEPYRVKASDNLMILVQTVRQKLTNLQRVNLGALITIEVHARDIVDKLADAKISSTQAFEWSSQLRSYWHEDDCVLRQVEAHFVYGYEYLGNSTRLVITPLTDRIYLTLTGAMHMFLGSAPAGPAGTGKTETVKDLAKALAKQCVVFNCQEGMTYASMGKFFKGLANAGAWACFDEFNRIDVEVLSVVAQQVSQLQEAARSKQYRITFEGTEIVVDPTYSIFITMNPGYAGRTELPDNLKMLFRPVACMVPDYAMIGEIRLFSYGYETSRKLAQKMVATFRLSSEQLSSQDHYDFGMRAVNTVISAAGLMKREYPDDPEDVLLLRALRDSNAPKFLAEDLSLFNGIISDLFPKVAIPPVDYGMFEEILKTTCTEMKLQPVDKFLLKCIQLFEMTVLRHGLMAVGPTMGGKTSATRVLQKAMTVARNDHNLEKFSEIWTFVCNPKSITMGQLYGQYDEATNEWSDGILAGLFRKAAGDTSAARKWVIFDGPVDALWIESMNTVLDENKKLCLVSGEIITMSALMNVWFEVEDLAVASPATVSRAGMIYLEPISCIGTMSYVKSWIEFVVPSTFDEVKPHLTELCETFLQPAVEFVHRNLAEYSPTVLPNLLSSFFNFYHGFLEPFTPTRTTEVAKEKVDQIPDVYIPLFFFSLIWSIGATTDLPSRKKFDKYLRDEIKRVGVNSLLPDTGLVFDYEFLVEDRRWSPWLDQVPAQVVNVPLGSDLGDLIVETTDVVRYKWILKHLLLRSHHTLCVGPTGTGKSVLITQLLFSSMPNDVFTPIFFTFSARTHANQTQDLIFSKFEVRRRAPPQIYGAPAGRKFIIFVDDLNMPLKEKYGAQPPIELLRQWMDYEGWYDRKSREFYLIQDIMFVSAMGPPGGGRNFITNRFLRHFNLLSMPDIDDDNAKKIFGTALNAFMRNGFSEDVSSKSGQIVDSCIEIYNTIIDVLRPRPSRPHYLFNLRDLARVFNGILSAEPKSVSTGPGIIRMYMHELTRTFRDRLVDSQDRTWFDDLIKKQLQKYFSSKWSDIVSTERLIYGDFINPNADIRIYDEMNDLQHLATVMESYMDSYNEANQKKMNLVMFLDAIEHIARLSRVLRKPGGHALLLGVGGSGRQSSARMAAFINDFDTFQVEISKAYNMNAWREDLKTVLRRVSFENKPTVFCFTDTQVINEQMLEDINNVLNSGEVPNLFFGPDLDEIMNAMKPFCVAEGIPCDKVNMYARFVKFSKTNLHIALCMSPLGETFRERLRMFPALVNCCTIDWFSAWPDQALTSVAREFFVSIEMANKDMVDACIKMCVVIHQSVEGISAKFLHEARRYNYVTPTSYLELLTTFRRLLAGERKKLYSRKNLLSGGLEKLRVTEIQVAELQVSLEQDQPLLLQRKEQIEILVKEIAEKAEAAEETRESAVADEKAASEIAEETTAVKKEAQDLLDQALPALDKALESLNQLNVSQISEVAKYASPPQGVRLVMEGVCIMMGRQPMMVDKNPGMPGPKVADYWAASKELLSRPNVLLDSLLNYKRDSIPDKTIKKIAPLVTNPDFTPEKIKLSSSACAAMCSWVHAMYTYHFVALEVKPKKERLAEAEAKLAVVEEKLSVARGALKAVEDQLQELNDNKTSAENEMQELQRKVEQTEIKLDRANRLIQGLAGEKKNWKVTIDELTEREKYLVGDVLCASGQVSYMGPFTSKFRTELLELWKRQLDTLDVLHSDDVSVFETMQDPIESRKWTLHGLPADQVSIENAIILHNATRWPLIIDPQLQANKWIRGTYKDQLEVIKPSNKDMIKRIELSIRNGRPVLLENVTDQIDPSLEPLLLRQIFVQGGTEMIRIGENPIQWNPQFKFFMTTKLPNPHYIPEVMVKVTLLNFFITPLGLEDQLLGALVGKERPDLESQKNMLVQQNATMKEEIADIQRTILRMLEEAQGDILEDESIIIYLDKSKVKTAEINEKMAESEIIEKDIDAAREGFRPVAFHSSILYFCCADLSAVDPMYQYSLQWYIQLFEAGIENSEKSDDVKTRLSNLNSYFTYSFYQNISRSLFEKHKLMFSFVLCIRILQGDNLIDEDEWRFLLAGPASQPTGLAPNPAPEWLTEVTWSDLTYLDKHLPAFKGITGNLAGNVEHYYKLFMSMKAHAEPLAGEWAENLNLFQKLLFLRCMRSDKLMEGVQDFVSYHLGEKFISPPPFDLATSFKDSTPTTPLIFVLSPGADPFDDWKKFAEQQRMSKRLSDISLGQGQGPKAERYMKDGMENGSWVLLQNCHLAASWMSTLERLVENMPQGVNPTYRLWLTSMPNPFFPVSILQNGIKMTNEPPKGMRANVGRSISQYSNDFMERCAKPDILRKLTFSLCFFHALIQERRKFGPLGWNIAYEYTTGDLSCCIQQLQMFLDKYDEVPYRVINELSGNIHYGGRVTDDWDRRTLLTLLQKFVNADVLSDNYKFSPSGVYSSIPVADQDGYQKYIETWPYNTHPEVFGLHENADITCARNETFDTLATIQLLQAGGGSGGGAKTSDDIVSELANNILSRIREPFDMYAMSQKYPTRYEDSMNTVLVQEAIRYNKLIGPLRSSLENILLAIKGMVVMSKELDSIYAAMFVNQVPDAWADKAYPSLKPLAAWVTDLVLRLKMIENWYKDGHPKAYWISGFYFPQAFLTGILQNYARREQISIDTISYAFRWISDDPEKIESGPDSGCYIHGMYIEGARFHETKLILDECRPKVLFEATPMLWLVPEKNRVKPTTGVYNSPLYKTLRRAGTLSTTGHSTNYVLTAEIPTPDIPAEHWIGRGVAMVCALSY